MTLAAGTRLGPYEVESAIGAGGMGEVYKARDTRLDRTVAIKVLPRHLSSSAELRTRFEREARAISSLQHPHICVLHDVGRDESSGTDFLVMEYLEGETLAKRLTRGPLPPDLVLRITVEIAEALDRAHKQALVHRDLKPGNIMLTKSGAKLMDFGLAKPAAMMSAAGSSTTPAFTAATVSSPATPLTAAGSIVGTYQYMSPEQIEGRESDGRSDIFAFGAVLYEMLSGRRAFEGKSQLSVASAILEKDPEPISAIQPLVSPALSRVVSTCLEKDPDARFQTAHDLKLQLQWIHEAGSQAAVPAVVKARRRVSDRMKWAAIATGWTLAIMGLAAAWNISRTVDRARALRRAEIMPPPNVSIAPVIPGAAALSPDGTRFVFIAGDSPQAGVLWLRDLRTGESRLIEGGQDGIFPFWSPDSRFIAFFADGKLKKVPADGGPVQIICDALDGRGGSWSPNGWIIFTPNIAEPLFKVREGGGTPEQLTKVESEKGVRSHRNPYFLPDGNHFLFVSRVSNEREGRVLAGSLDGMEHKPVLQRGTNVQYAAGYLLYVLDRNLLAQRFDPSKLRLEGDPIALAQGIDYWNPRDLSNFAANDDTLLYRTHELVTSQFGWLDVASGSVQLFGESGQYTGVTVSPDGRKAGFLKIETGGSSDVWLMDLERLSVSRLTFEGAAGGSGASYAFSPDSTRVAVALNTSGTRKITLRSATGATDVETIFETPDWVSAHDWSRDGRNIIIGSQRSRSGMDVLYVPLEGDRKPVPLLTSAHNEQNPSISPNGKWLAYMSDESGRPEVYITDFPAAKRRIQVTSTGGNQPEWSSDGTNLFFADNSVFYAMQVRDPDKMVLGDVRKIPTPSLVGGDFLPGEKRALVLQRAGESASRPFMLVLNWTRMLEKK